MTKNIRFKVSTHFITTQNKNIENGNTLRMKIFENIDLKSKRL